MSTRNRSAPHAFQENIAAEKAKLKAQPRWGYLKSMLRLAHGSAAPATQRSQKTIPPTLAFTQGLLIAIN